MRSWSELTYRVLNYFHAALKEGLPSTRNLSQQVCSIHQTNHSELQELRGLYLKLREKVYPATRANNMELAAHAAYQPD